MLKFYGNFCDTLIREFKHLLNSIKMKTEKKTDKHGFEPYKFVFVSEHVLEMPRVNVDKQIRVELWLNLAEMLKQLNLTPITTMEVEPEESVKEKTQYIV